MDKVNHNFENIIIKPLSTEKSMLMEKAGKYVFLVNKNTNRIMVQKAVEKIYKTEVMKVNIIPTRQKTVRRGKTVGKRGLRAKKAIVTLKKGQTLAINSTKSSTKAKKTEKK